MSDFDPGSIGRFLAEGARVIDDYCSSNDYREDIRFGLMAFHSCYFNHKIGLFESVDHALKCSAPDSDHVSKSEIAGMIEQSKSETDKYVKFELDKKIFSGLMDTKLMKLSTDPDYLSEIRSKYESEILPLLSQ